MTIVNITPEEKIYELEARVSKLEVIVKRLTKKEKLYIKKVF